MTDTGGFIVAYSKEILSTGALNQALQFHPPLQVTLQQEDPPAFTQSELAALAQAQQELMQRRQNDRALRRSEAAAQPLAQFKIPAEATQQPVPSPVIRIPQPSQAELAPVRPLELPQAAQQAQELAEAAQGAMKAALTALEGKTPRRDRLGRNLRVYQALVEGAVTLGLAREHKMDRVNSYTYFTVLDVLPAVTGLSTSSCERATADLRAIGWLDTHSYFTTGSFRDEEGEYTSKTVRAGSWICVLLKTGSQQAKVRKEELEWKDGKLASPRDLAGDRFAGRTAYQLRQEVKESSSQLEERFKIDLLVQWSLNTALSPEVSYNSLTSPATVRDFVWDLRLVANAYPQHRSEVISLRAQQLATQLGDQQSVRHYMRILWRAIEAENEGYPGFGVLEAALLRVVVAAEEGELRNPGAYLIHLLRESGWWERVYL